MVATHLYPSTAASSAVFVGVGAAVAGGSGFGLQAAAAASVFALLAYAEASFSQKLTARAVQGQAPAVGLGLARSVAVLACTFGCLVLFGAPATALGAAVLPWSALVLAVVAALHHVAATPVESAP